MEIEVLDRDLFLSKSGVLIGTKYIMQGKIPKQMDSSKTSKYVDKLGMILQDKIDAFSTNSVVFNMILYVKLTLNFSF